MDGRLDDAFLRVDRAAEHLASFKRLSKRYFDAHERAWEAVVMGNKVGWPGGAIVQENPPPRRLGLLVGETVQNLRTALDYLVFQMADWHSGPDPERRTQFPIESTPEGFRARRNTHLKGVCDEHVALLNGCSRMALLIGLALSEISPTLTSTMS
jgi:hypothetical protein